MTEGVSQGRRRHRLLLTGSLAVLLLAVLVAQLQVTASMRDELDVRLQLAASSIADQLQSELDRLADLALDLEVALRPHEQLDEQRFAEVMTELGIQERFPMLVMVAYTDHVARPDLDAYLAERARTGEPLRIRDDAGGERLRPVRYVHPPGFARTLGVDADGYVASRAAADRAAASGRPQLSAKTELPTGDGASLQVPVRRTDGTVTGTISLVVLSADLLSSLEPLPAPLQVTLTDPAADGEAFSGRVGRERASGNRGWGANASENRAVGIGEHLWQLQIRPGEEFLAPVGQRPTTTVGLLVLALLLVAGLVGRDLVSRKRSADRRASRSDAELQLANARLTVTNRALTETNARLERTNQRLQELDTIKDGLLAGVSHEMRTPLTVIGGIAETLERLPDDTPRAPLLASLRRSTRRLDGLLDDLLTLASLDAGHTTARPHNLSVAEAVSEVVAEAPAIHEQLPAAQLVCLVDPSAWVHADPAHLRRILHKLLANAVQHGRPPIRIAAGPGDGEVVLTVCDHGDGVAPDERRHVFSRFSRGRATDRSKGTGLGLPVAAALAALNGGGLRYVPGPDHGPGPRSCFELRLPSAPGNVGSDEAEEPGGALITLPVPAMAERS